MGRPISKHYLGNVSTTGHVITGQAWVAGDSQPRPSYIVKQRGATSFIMAPIAGNGVTAGGQVYLVNGPITQAGQGNILVTPYGAIGSGAIGNANVGIYNTVAISNVGTGSVTASYKPGEILSLSGGTYTGNQQANVVVEAVQVRNYTVQANGAHYTVGDYFLFSGAGYSQPANVVVNATSGTGGVTNLTIIQSGVYTGATLPANPLAPTSQTVSNANAAGVTFNFGWGLQTVGVANTGDYTVPPTNPVALTGSANGTGATIAPSYVVSSMYVINPGSGYNGAPTVEFTTGNAQASAVVNTAGYVTGFTLFSGGSNIPSVPNVVIVDTAQTFNISKFTDRLVYTYSGNSYNWVLTGVPLAGPTYATIQSQ
jgi:hypothetical protein